MLPVGAKRLYSERESDVRVHFDVISASEADKNHCLEELKKVPAITFAEIDDARLAELSKTYYGRSMFRSPAAITRTTRSCSWMM